MNRRRLLLSLGAALVVPAPTVFLPPRNGWPVTARCCDFIWHNPWYNPIALPSLMGDVVDPEIGPSILIPGPSIPVKTLLDWLKEYCETRDEYRKRT